MIFWTTSPVGRQCKAALLYKTHLLRREWMKDSSSCVPVVLVADPPWPFNDKLPHGGSENHYQCMSIEDIRQYPLPNPVLDSLDAVLFLWRLSSMPEEALSVIRHWGFTPKSELIWKKLTKTGKRHFGMGRYVRLEHEVCHIATTGRAQPEIRNVRSIFEAPVLEHSRKPDEFYRIVEAMYPSSPKYELFARERRKGWKQSGIELGKLPSMSVAEKKAQGL